MSKFIILLVALLVAASSAFAPQMASTRSVVKSASVAAPIRSSAPLFSEASDEDGMYWEGEYPPSKVLGPIMSKMPSGMLGMLSIVFATMCVLSVAGSATLVRGSPDAVATGAWVKWYYVLGSFGGPLAWGTHVAAWIQRMNGK